MSEIGELAISRATYQSAHGPRFGVGECMMRTRALYGAPAIGDYDGDGSADAEDGWKFAKLKHPFDGDYAGVPRGVPFWWSGGSNDNGHVAPTLGDGECMSTDILRGGYYDKVPLALIAQRWGLKPLGWTEDIDGVRVWSPPLPPPVQPVRRETADMALLADLDAARRKHDASRLKAVRVLLRAVRDAAVNRPIRAARIRAALAAVKGMK
jgi:hypothetical protein